MIKCKRVLPVIPVTMAALILGGTAPASWADHNEIPFEVAKVFFQLNDTDQDLGIQFKISGQPWKRVKVEDPTGRTIFKIRPQGMLRRQGGSELAFESGEPTFDVLSPEEFFSRFPEGEYEVEGITLDGEEIESSVDVTQVMPDAPTNVQISGTAVPEDCEAGPVPLVSDPVIITWDPVTESHPTVGKSGPIQVVSYEFAVERAEPTELNFTAILPADVTSFQIPEALTASGEEFAIQVLATDIGGNETSSAGCFVVN